MIRFIVTMLFGITALGLSAEPKAEPEFPERVRAFLSSAWTELSITTALVTDYGEVHATSVRLRRDTPKSPVHFSLPLGPAGPSKDTVTEADLQTLYSSTLAVAKATFEHRYPIEILYSLPREKAIEMFKSGELKIGPNDVEMLIIRGRTSTGEVTLTETGPFSGLDTTIQRLFRCKRVEVKNTDYMTILGGNPYGDL
jgi:hypothetical protein